MIPAVLSSRHVHHNRCATRVLDGVLHKDRIVCDVPRGIIVSITCPVSTPGRLWLTTSRNLLIRITISHTWCVSEIWSI